MAPRRRRLLPLALVLVLADRHAVDRARNGGRARTRICAALACGMPHEELLRTWRGWSADRGGELQMIAKEPNFVGSGLPHVGPWDYVQRVPMLWYGPGFVPARGVGAAARHVGRASRPPPRSSCTSRTPHRTDAPMTEALLPEAERPDPPKLIVTVVWDAGGTQRPGGASRTRGRT